MPLNPEFALNYAHTSATVVYPAIILPKDDYTRARTRIVDHVIKVTASWAWLVGLVAQQRSLRPYLEFNIKTITGD